jgi:hypothetical protein
MRYHATNPLQVEFSTGRISPALKYYAQEVATAWEQAHRLDVPNGDDDDVALDITSPFHDGDDPSEFADQRGSVEKPTVSHLMLPADPKAEPYWVNSPWHEVCGFPPELIAGTDPTRLRGAECGANAKVILQRLEYRCAHLWPIVLDAVIRRKTMAEIGEAFGGNSQSAASIGRAMVVAGLRFCRLVLDDLGRGNAYGLGGTFHSLPKWAQRAENDNRRAIRPQPKPNGREPASRAEMAKAAAMHPTKATKSA